MRKISTTQERLKIIMQEKNLRQSDVLALVQPYCQRYGITISQSLFCQYCNGTRAPKPDRLIVLAKALNVHEDWLAGYDVDRESGYKINSSLPEDLELPIKDLFRVFEYFGYTMDKTDQGYVIQKGDFKSFVYSTEELLYKYHLLANYCRHLIQTDMYVEKDNLVDIAYQDML